MPLESEIYMSLSSNLFLVLIGNDSRRNDSQRVKEENVNELVPPPTPQNPQVPMEEGAMSNVEIRVTIHSLTQVLAIQVSRDTRVQVVPYGSTSTSRIRYFTRMNPPTFYVSKVEEDPQEFIDKVFMVLDAIGVSSQEKVELAPTNSKTWVKFGMSNGGMKGRLEKARLLGELSR